MDTLTPNGTPSLIDCDKLVIEGKVEFAAGVVINLVGNKPGLINQTQILCSINTDVWFNKHRFCV